MCWRHQRGFQNQFPPQCGLWRHTLKADVNVMTLKIMSRYGTHFDARCRVGIAAPLCYPLPPQYKQMQFSLFLKTKLHSALLYWGSSRQHWHRNLTTWTNETKTICMAGFDLREVRKVCFYVMWVLKTVWISIVDFWCSQDLFCSFLISCFKIWIKFLITHYTTVKQIHISVTAFNSQYHTVHRQDMVLIIMFITKTTV